MNWHMLTRREHGSTSVERLERTFRALLLGNGPPHRLVPLAGDPRAKPRYVTSSGCHPWCAPGQQLWLKASCFSYLRPLLSLVSVSLMLPEGSFLSIPLWMPAPIRNLIVCLSCRAPDPSGHCCVLARASGACGHWKTVSVQLLRGS